MLVLSLLLVACGGAGNDESSDDDGLNLRDDPVTTTGSVPSDDSGAAGGAGTGASTTPTGVAGNTGGGSNKPGTATPTGPTITIFIGVAPIKLDMTGDRVEELLGPPKSRNTQNGELGSFTELMYPGLVVELGAETRKVSAVTTSRTTDRTPKGVGPGSTEAQLLAAHPEVDCDPAPEEPRICRLENEKRAVTDFFVEGGKVSQVVIGYIID